MCGNLRDLARKLLPIEGGVVDEDAHRLLQQLPAFRGGLVFKAHRLFYHSTLGSIVIKKKKKSSLWVGFGVESSWIGVQGLFFESIDCSASSQFRERVLNSLMIEWTSLTPWEIKCLFLSSISSTF